MSRESSPCVATHATSQSRRRIVGASLAASAEILICDFSQDGITARLHTDRFWIKINLRMLDAAIFKDVLAVITPNSLPGQRVHEYLRCGGARFEKMLKRFGLKTET